MSFLTTRRNITSCVVLQIYSRNDLKLGLCIRDVRIIENTFIFNPYIPSSLFLCICVCDCAYMLFLPLHSQQNKLTHISRPVYIYSSSKSHSRGQGGNAQHAWIWTLWEKGGGQEALWSRKEPDEADTPFSFSTCCPRSHERHSHQQNCAGDPDLDPHPRTSPHVNAMNSFRKTLKEQFTQKWKCGYHNHL